MLNFWQIWATLEFGLGDDLIQPQAKLLKVTDDSKCVEWGSCMQEKNESIIVQNAG